MEWIKDNWFKVAVLLLIPITAIILIYGIVVYPEKIRQEERAKQALQEKNEAELDALKETERVESLNTCLKESEYQETSSHLALCGDPSVGYAPQSCHAVFSGAKDIADVIIAYDEEFPGKLPKLTNPDDLESNFNQRLDIVNEFYDKCNCGLEKSRRDELTKAKEYRDSKCYALYGKS